MLCESFLHREFSFSNIDLIIFIVAYFVNKCYGNPFFIIDIVILSPAPWFFPFKLPAPGGQGVIRTLIIGTGLRGTSPSTVDLGHFTQPMAVFTHTGDGAPTEVVLIKHNPLSVGQKVRSGAFHSCSTPTWITTPYLPIVLHSADQTILGWDCGRPCSTSPGRILLSSTRLSFAIRTQMRY